jgi:ribonuclease R
MKTQKNFPEEFLGVVAGHRDGHGFISREDGGADIYLAPNEMRAVLHKDKVKVLIVRSDRRGRPEGRVTEIVERSASPIIGRLLHEGGTWLVAPEDKRYGQDILIPKNCFGRCQSPVRWSRWNSQNRPALYSSAGWAHHGGAGGH